MKVTIKKVISENKIICIPRCGKGYAMRKHTPTKITKQQKIKTVPKKQITNGCICNSCTVYTGCNKGFCEFEEHYICKNLIVTPASQDNE